MAIATDKADASAAPKTDAKESLVEMGVDLFRKSVKPLATATDIVRMGDKIEIKRDGREHKKGDVVAAKRDVVRVMPVSKIQEANPNLSKVQAQAMQKKAGKDLLRDAAHYIAEAQQDEAVICNRITHSLTDLNVNLHRVSVQDEAMKLHVSTGRPLEECRAFIAGKAVKAVK